MIRYGDAHISRVIGLNKLAFRARVLDGHIVWRTRSNTRFFYRSARLDNDFTPGFKRFHPRTLVCFDCVLTATDIRPVACSVPTNGQSIDKYVRLLPQIEDGHWAARVGQQKLETISRKLATPRCAQIGQAGVGGQLAFVCLERVVSRAEIPRQTLVQLWIDVPNQRRRACVGRRGGRSLLHQRRRENRCGSEKGGQYKIPARRPMNVSIHKDRAAIGRGCFLAGKEFLAVVLRTRN